jgi:hypothetical protein
MSLFALPVAVADLTTLQSGITFKTDVNEATSEAAKINSLTDTVFGYATGLLDSQVALSVVSMGVNALMFNQTPTIATLTNQTTAFLPGEVAFAVKLGLNPTVFAAEALAVTISSNPLFTQTFGTQNLPDFAATVSNLTGVNTTAILGWVSFWKGFYATNPDAIPAGSTADLAAKAGALGDAFGNALALGLPVGDKVENAILTIATGQYAEGFLWAFGLPQHTALQGEPPPRVNVLAVNANAPATTAIANDDGSSVQLIGINVSAHVADHTFV